MQLISKSSEEPLAETRRPPRQAPRSGVDEQSLHGVALYRNFKKMKKIDD